MMLINGEIIDSNTEDKYIDRLYDSCVNTLNQSQPVTPEIVISACDRLYQVRKIPGACEIIFKRRIGI